MMMDAYGTYSVTDKEILVFRTDIGTAEDIAAIAQVLDRQKGIHRWTVDTEDIDKVLRVEADGICMEEITTLITETGYYCCEL